MRFHIEPLHPIPVDHFGDGITFSRDDLVNYGHTLSNKPININHAGLVHRFPKFGTSLHTRNLPYPDNRTLEIRYNPRIDGLSGEMEISDINATNLITNYQIRGLSVEHSRSFWGLEFDCLALLTREFPPRDPKTRILHVMPARYW